jgi:RNA polymerase sigma-70 factor (ECF subfamily)
MAKPADLSTPSGSPPNGPGGRESELIAAYRRGDRSAAEALVERTYSAVYAALFRLTGGDRDLAADLTQDTYRRAWQALPRFQGRSRLATWLYRIAYTTFLNHVRRPRPVDLPVDEGASELPEPGPGPEQNAAAATSGARLRAAVLGLPEDLRFTVTARFWGEQPVREIAQSEGVSSVAIRKRLKKALGLLAETLREEVQ